MKGKRRWPSIWVFCLLAMAWATPGSNRGFLIRIPLHYGYHNMVSLPYNNQYTTLQSAFFDIPNCTSIGRWDASQGLWLICTGYRGQCSAPLIPGESIKVTVTQETSWTVVGTHDNNAQVQLHKVPDWGQNWIAWYWNWVAPPYHSKMKTASDLFLEIPNCLGVSRWNNGQGIMEKWDGTGQPPDNVNFLITPGEGYNVQVSADGTWTPSHY
jgi:hypothetical protein